jgi:UDP-N-acetylmuramate--alanine ligase
MRYHIVGIAGSGMGAIAHLLLDQGHEVSGSDLVATHQTARLAERGAQLFVGHAAEQVQGADAVLTTSAARPDHVELVAVRAAGLPLLKRADLWRVWSAQRDVVAVAGTHGKTTTSAMIAFALEQAGLDPGYLVGAEVPDLAAPARWGSGPFVVEADEYDHTFLALTPQIAVVTNIGWDHVDCYPDAHSYHAAFRQFAGQTQAALIGCTDDAGVRALRAAAQGPLFQGYGTGGEADWRILDDLDASEPRWELHSPLGHVVPFALALPGAHNRLNAAAAAAACALLGLAPAATLHVLSYYQGAALRAERRSRRRARHRRLRPSPQRGAGDTCGGARTLRGAAAGGLSSAAHL